MTGTAPVADTTGVPPKSPLKTKTFWFSVLGAAAQLISNPKDPQAIMNAIAIVGAGWSFRQAVSKNGVGA